MEFQPETTVAKFELWGFYVSESQRSGFSQRRLWNRAKSPSVEQRMMLCSKARAARMCVGNEI